MHRVGEHPEGLSGCLIEVGEQCVVLGGGPTTHVGLLDDANGSVDSIRAIAEVVTEVRTDVPLAPR